MANWFLDMIRDSTPRGQMELRQEMQNRRRDEYLAAAQQFGQVMPEGQMGPPAAYSNANPGGISPEFAMRVAGIPGYQQLGAQMLDMSQRRNMAADERAYLANNMPMYQRESLAQQQRQFEAGQALNREQFSTLSPYQQGVLGLQRRGQDLQAYEADQRLALARGEAEAKRRGGGFPLPGSKEWTDQLTEQQGFQSGIDAIADLRKTWGNQRFSWTDRDAMAAGGPAYATLLGVYSKLAGSGALNEGERDIYDQLINKPSTFGTSPEKRARMLESLERTLQRKLDQVAERNPNLPQVAAPPGFERGGRGGASSSY